MNISDQDITFALIDQVAKAADGDTERNVVTLISRPMWNAFCRYMNLPEDSEPTEWLGIHETIRVYGSETHVIDRPDFWSASSKNFVPLNNAPPQKT